MNYRAILKTAMSSAPYMRAAMACAAATAFMTACKDNFDISRIEGTPKMVMYCMPTTADTTIVALAESVPVNGRTGGTLQPQRLADAAVTYRLNGVEQPVENLGNGYYRVVAAQKAGDVVRVTARRNGLPDAEAVTVIPETVTPAITGMADVRADDGDGNFGSYVQIAARFNDDPRTRDYYAVRVTADYRFYVKDGNMYVDSPAWPGTDRAATAGIGGTADGTADGSGPAVPDGYSWDKTSSYMRWQELNIQSEPLLKPLTNSDSDFGFERNFFQNFYIFDDASLHAPTYTLHLNVPKVPTGQFGAFCATVRYRVVMYKISETAYRFLKSVNDMEGNDFASWGFSQITPTPSNVAGGLGFVGAFSTGQSQWKWYE